MSAIAIDRVVLDCPDPRRLAEFYARLLGGRVVSAEDDWVEVDAPGLPLGFQRAERYLPPSWPDGVPQQFHLDLSVRDYSEPHRLALSLGATMLKPTTEPGPDDGTFRVYADPAGHPFCLCLIGG